MWRRRSLLEHAHPIVELLHHDNDRTRDAAATVVAALSKNAARTANRIARRLVTEVRDATREGVMDGARGVATNTTPSAHPWCVHRRVFLRVTRQRGRGGSCRRIFVSLSRIESSVLTWPFFVCFLVWSCMRGHGPAATCAADNPRYGSAHDLARTWPCFSAASRKPTGRAARSWRHSARSASMFSSQARSLPRYAVPGLGLRASLRLAAFVCAGGAPGVAGLCVFEACLRVCVCVCVCLCTCAPCVPRQIRVRVILRAGAFFCVWCCC